MEFFNELNLNELGTSGVITLVLFVLTILGFIRGAVKLVFLLFTLAGAGYAAYWGAEVGFLYVLEKMPTAPPLLGDAVAAVCAIVAFYILSKIFGFFTNPFEESNFIARFAFGIPAAVISLVAAAGLIWGSLIFLKQKGAESEIRYWLSQDDTVEGGYLSNYPTLASLKQKFEESFIGKKVMNFYDVDDSDKHSLAKLLVIAKTSEGKISELALDENVRNVLSNDRVVELLKDPSVLKSIEDNDCRGLLQNKKLTEALKDKDLMTDLMELSHEQLK